MTKSMLVMTVLGHDTALTAWTEDFIFYFSISFILVLLAGSLSVITSSRFLPFHFAALSSEQLNNSTFPSLHSVGQACFRTVHQQKKMCYMRPFYWAIKAKQCLLHSFHCVAQRGQQLLKTQMPSTSSPFLLGSQDRRGVSEIPENLLSSSTRIFYLCPSHFA